MPGPCDLRHGVPTGVCDLHHLTAHHLVTALVIFIREALGRSPPVTFTHGQEPCGPRPLSRHSMQRQIRNRGSRLISDRDPHAYRSRPWAASPEHPADAAAELRDRIHEVVHGAAREAARRVTRYGAPGPPGGSGTATAPAERDFVNAGTHVPRTPHPSATRRYPAKGMRATQCPIHDES